MTKPYHTSRRTAKCPEQTEIDIGEEPGFSLTMETRQSKRGRDKRKYKPYGEDFVVVRILMDDVTDSIVVLDEIMIPQRHRPGR